MPLVAGVDSSTGSCKVEVRDLETGNVVGHGSAPHPATTPPRSEQDPAIWWSAFHDAWAAAGSPEVAAISVGGQQHGLVVLDAVGQPIRPAKLWNDTESAPDADWLIKQLANGAAGWAAAVGSVPVAAFTISKLSWLHRSEPENWRRVAEVLLPHDWLTYRLSGRFVTDRGDASGTGYWSPAEGRYRWDLLALVDPDRDWGDMVPDVAGPFDDAGGWHGSVVAPGTGDNMAAALGVGLRAGDTAISLGTSGTVYTVSATPTADPSGAVAGFADAAGQFLPLVCTLNATKVIDATRRLLGVDHAGFDQLVLGAPTGSGGVTLLPYFDGERTPNRPNATGTIIGLRSDVSREQLARATVEGVLCGLLDGFDELHRHASGSDGRVVLVGGGARSVGSAQLLADMLGRVVTVPDADEHVAAGACVQAAAVLTQTPHAAIAAAWGLGRGREIEPVADPDQVAELRARYSELRESTA